MGVPIVFLEPSDWSAVVDDYAALLPGDRRLAVAAAHCYTFEQYLVNLFDRGELSLQYRAEPKQVLLHTHCHQKALGGTKASVRALSLPPGYKVSEIDSSCCGMAGAFGYEAEHYAVSLKMSEHKLADAVRSAAEALKEDRGRRRKLPPANRPRNRRAALHPAEAIWQALR